MLWINLHGSWLFGMCVLVVIIGSGLLEGRWGSVVAYRWSSTHLRALSIALVASIAALFVNPFGYKLLLSPFEFLHMQRLMQFSEYWRPIDFSSWNGTIALVAIFVLMATTLSSRRPWRLDEVVLIIIALWAGAIYRDSGFLCHYYPASFDSALDNLLAVPEGTR